MQVFIGSDHAAVELREQFATHLREVGHEVTVFGPAGAEDKTDYPDVAVQVTDRVAATEGSLGVLVCGTGQGMAMTANRRPGIRAAVCAEPFSAAMARAHNDANVLCVGARVLGAGSAQLVLDTFLSARFEGGRHAARVAKLNAAGR